jgi:RimJ/RimL family protein N-acetyltransferase
VKQPDEKTRLRADYKRWITELSAILYRVDPVELNFDVNPNEYDPEARTILPRLRNCDSVEDVDRVVREELTSWFSHDVVDSSPTYHQLVDEIWSWWQRASRPRLSEVRLRDIEPSDLPTFYEHQLDADATRMAAFPARDRAAFDAHWATNVLGNPAAINRTILVDGQVAGNIGSWPQDGVRLVSYWLGKEHWGKGVATRALGAFLHLVTERPLHAHVARHNVGSIRVLEKCGFTVEREESGDVTSEDVTELVLR